MVPEHAEHIQLETFGFEGGRGCVAVARRECRDERERERDFNWRLLVHY